jgi:aminoglycoside phosphotransferase (APT) family kinase protein
VLRILHQAGFPVLEPLWCETETAPLGQPFMLSAALPPGADPRWSEADDDDSRAEACLALARILGRLHSLDERVIAAAGFTPSGDPRREIRAAVESWRDRWLALRTHPSPTLQAAFLWLLDHAPAGITRTSLLHGDLSADSLAVDGTRIAALLDWEFAHLGDPAEDLAACRPWVEPLVPWNEFLRAYRSAGGMDPDPASSAYYAIWRGVRNAVCCCIAWRGFTSGAYPALGMAYLGIPLYRRHVRDTAERLRREWARQDT